MSRFDDDAPVERWVELVHLDVDGEASPAQRAELLAHLAVSAEARRLHDAVRSLSGELDAMAQTPAAPAMRETVMAAVRGRSVRRTEGAEEASAFLLRRKAVFAIAAGVGAILVGLAALFPTFQTPSDAAGTIAPWPVVQRIESQDNALTLLVRQRGHRVALETRANGNANEITIAWDPTKLRAGDVWPESVRRTNSSVTFPASRAGSGVVLEPLETTTRAAEVEVLVGGRRSVRARIALE